MGCRACLVTKYVCEYDGSQSFNWLAEELYGLLNSIGVRVWTSGGDGDYYGRWEIELEGESGENMRKYIAKLGELPPEDVNHYFTKNPDDDYVTNDYVKSVFEEWLKQGEIDGNEFVRVHWL